MQWHRIHPTDSSGIKFAQNKVHVWHKNSVFVNIYYFKITKIAYHDIFYFMCTIYYFFLNYEYIPDLYGFIE